MKIQKWVLIGEGEELKTLAEDLKKKPNIQLIALVFVSKRASKAMVSLAANKIELLAFGSIERWLPRLGVSVSNIAIALNVARHEFFKKLLDSPDVLRCNLQILPLASEARLLQGKSPFQQLRQLSAEDLIGRRPIASNEALLAKHLQAESVLVTGAGGTIGSALMEQLSLYPLKEIIAVSHGEHSLYMLSERLKTLALAHKNMPKISYVLGNVQDKQFMLELLQEKNPKAIFHTAAYKHITFVENNEKEGLKNNTLATKTLLESAKQCGIKHFFFISTDKAVNPSTVMGMTKRLSEKLVQHARQRLGMNAVVIRFSNVIGSRGSVMPLFKKQIEMGGPLTVTDPLVERYFMAIPDAAILSLSVAALAMESFYAAPPAENVENWLYMLDMDKPVKIYDLMQMLLRLYENKSLAARSGAAADIPITYIGLRKGEKMNEKLFYTHTRLQKTQNSSLFTLHEPALADAASIWETCKALESSLMHESRASLLNTMEKLLYKEIHHL